MSVKQQETEETIVKCQNWFRLALCINNPVKEALVAILHNTISNPSINGLPSDPNHLYNFMVSNRNKLKRSKVLKQDQLAELLPQGGKVSSASLDITLLRFLIQTFSGITNEDNHWKKPRHDDHSIAAAVFTAADLRNRVFHYRNPQELGDVEFEEMWGEIEQTLADLFYGEDISDLKEKSLDPVTANKLKEFHANMAEDFDNILLDYKQSCKNKKKDELKTFIKRSFKDVSRNDIVYVDTLLKRHDFELDKKLEKLQSNMIELMDTLIPKFVDEPKNNIADVKTMLKTCEKELVELKQLIKQNFGDELLASLNDLSEKMNLMKTLIQLTLKLESMNDIIDDRDESINDIIDDRNESINDIIDDMITDIDQLLISHDSVMVSGEAGLGKTFAAQHLKYSWSSGKIWKEKKLLYIDSKKVNKDMYKPSHAAPVCISELKNVLKDKTEGYLESFGCVKKAIENLVVVIDGVDELHIEESKLNLQFLKKLEVKIDKNEEISAMETIMGIYFGIFFPGSKIIVFGRKNEIYRLKGIQDMSEQSNLFNKQTRAILELQPLDEDGIKELISRENCNKTCCSCAKCTNTYSLVKDVEFRNVPSHLMALIKISNDVPRTEIGRITKTKIFIITIFNLLKSHTSIKNLIDVKTFKKLLTSERAKEFRKCIQNIAEICFFSLLVGNVTIEVEEYNEDGVVYLKYEQIYQEENICKKIKREILEQLDFFYIFDLGYHFILEPYHLTNMEFLASSYIHGHPDRWDLLLKLNAGRQNMILPYVAGLHSTDRFTQDFVSELFLQDTSNHDIENYLNWLFTIEDVINDLPLSKWYGLKENDQLFPSFDLLHRINEEVDKLDDISKRMEEVQTLLLHKGQDFEWYKMTSFKHLFLTNNKKEYNIESFMSDFKKYRIVIKGDVEITNMEQFNLLSEMFQNERLKSKIFNLNFNLVMPQSTQITKPLKSMGLLIKEDCDSHTIDLLLDTSSLPPTTTKSSDIFPVFKCRNLDFKDVTQLNDQQIEKLFEIGLSGVLDYIVLRKTFFTGQQIEILKKVESRYTNKLINIQLHRMEFNNIFDLPNLDNRRVFLSNTIGKVTDSDVNDFQKYITPKYTKNYSNYKIINPVIPFIRKENGSQSYKQSMYFHFNNVNFEEVSPVVFGNTFSLIPSLECEDDHLIPSSHWSSLSQTNNCHINELRILKPKPVNFDYFINIKTNIIQFIFESKDDLKHLLDHIVNNPIVRLDREMKVFAVKCDKYDWEYYEEISLFDVKTIEEYRNNHCTYDLLIDKFLVPYHEGVRQDNWCCEISLLPLRNSNEVHGTENRNDVDPSQKNNNLSWLWLGLGLALGLGLLLKHRFVR